MREMEKRRLGSFTSLIGQEATLKKFRGDVVTHETHQMLDDTNFYFANAIFFTQNFELRLFLIDFRSVIHFMKHRED